MSEEKLSIEEQYKSMSEIDHILERPGMYVGSIYNELRKYLLYKPSEKKIIQIDNIPYNAGLLKLFDEVFTNSIDARRTNASLFHIDTVNVHVQKNGIITVSDNGGISVVIHKQTQVYLPVMLFGMLRTSGNYNENRQGAGLNGIGSKLTNIYSKYFKVITSDGINEIDVQWSNHMKNIDYEKVKPVSKSTHGTKFEFQLDLSRFGITELDMSSIRIMQKRCIDGAAANPGLTINFTTDIVDGVLDSTWKFNSFNEFVLLHLNETNETINQNQIDDIVLTENLGYEYGFINGAVCSDKDGTQFKKVYKQIVSKILDVLKSKEIELITETDIKNKISLFINASVTNPDYSSQTKEKLTSKILGSQLNLNKQFLKSIETSQIVEQLVDFYNIKYLADQKKQLKKLNGLLKTTKSKKLIGCSSKGNDNELWLFEGTSAANGFENYRNPLTMAAYQLRGKVKNTLNLTKEEIVNNIELREIIAALGLQFNDPRGNIKNCKFMKIIFGTDADFDGSHICGLLIVFFAKHFPELFLDGRIYRALSPIVIAAKGEEELYFYTMDEFNNEKNNLKGYEISYIKGLGGLQDHHYDLMLNNQRLIKFTIKNKDYMQTVKTWFDKSTTLRKSILLEESNGDNEDAA